MINFYSETEFDLGDRSPAIRNWLYDLAKSYSFEIGELSYIFCDDEYLLPINQEYLNHDEFTDIITFDYTNKKLLGGDIFISIERVRENAASLSLPFQQELGRVMAHGLLHLIGFQDKSESESEEMRQAENLALSLASFPFQ